VLLRRELRTYVDGLNWLDDVVFLGRVAVFAAYVSLRRLKRIIPIGKVEYMNHDL